ncbi:hypothetical protein [Falsiroseomonas sp.]|uniref:hypothetical protein n=1 Tax=Falsiroseomonas sp. TaxID=2870721 RepID=UPI003561C3E7
MRFLRRGLPAALLLIGLAAPAMAQSSDPSFRINNRSGVTIQEAYVSSAARSDWGQDHLGQNVLHHGQSLIVRLPVGECVNDIKLVFANGRSLERRNVNTCGITDYNIDP